ncbi:hypothetical protein LGH70_22715 [Hymenobacter sp. BT635]|uniref:DUF5723 domain-containing protein n=1 Tax=Hymenobacter nitidus TaxID=2880929 RepID=A0ABS8AJ15_9BACT|nr:hypothetical protein [Hymenobacter nitidus]MCB2380423.1 hypothetical protein [Hymenobacter nitidus]
MAAKFNNGTRAAGVVAYQDSEDPNQFYYFPQSINSSLGENLTDFLVTYWGISDSFYDLVDGKYQSICGGVMGGKAKIEITEYQTKQIEKKIKNDYNIKNPRLLPLFLINVKVQPTFAGNVLGINSGGDAVFPDTLSIGNEFTFVVGAANTRFASVVAARNRGEGMIVNPQFGINITGEAEFRGEPWTAEIECEISQVWSYARTHISASASFGWFKLGSGEYESIVRDLYRNNIIKSNYKEGSIFTEQYGRQMFEEAKKIFEAINAAALNGTGFFKFEPITDPEAKSSLVFGLFSGFSVSINASYTSSVFKQKINYKNTFTYTGNFKAKMPIGMALAVACNTSTYSHFQDINDSSEPCITDIKLRALNDRIRREEAKKDPLYARLQRTAGSIDHTEYARILAEIDNLNATETFRSLSQDNSKGIKFSGDSLIFGLDETTTDELFNI